MRKLSKKVLSVFIAAIMLFSLCSVVSFGVGAELKYEVNEFGQAVLISCNADATGVVTVDATVTINGKTYQVKSIGDEAFVGCDGVTKIVIPEGITSIGHKAFAKCLNLLEIDVPESLLTCDPNAFSDCGKLTINCHSTNYLFTTVINFGDDITIHNVDTDNQDNSTDENAKPGFFELLKRFFIKVLEFFGIKIG